MDHYKLVYRYSTEELKKFHDQIDYVYKNYDKY